MEHDQRGMKMSTKTYFGTETNGFTARVMKEAQDAGIVFADGCQLNPARPEGSAKSMNTLLNWMAFSYHMDFDLPVQDAKSKAVHAVEHVLMNPGKLKLHKEWRQLSWWALRVIDAYEGRPLTSKDDWEAWLEKHKLPRNGSPPSYTFTGDGEGEGDGEKGDGFGGFGKSEKHEDDEEEEKEEKDHDPTEIPHYDPEEEEEHEDEDNGTPPECEDENTLMGFLWRVMKYGKSKVTMAEDDGEVVSALLMGPAGVGKTYSVKDMAKRLGAEVFVITAGQRPSDYLGYRDAHGKYLASPMVEAIWYAQEHPDQLVVILYDELDMTPADVSGVLFSLFASRDLENLMTGKVNCPKNLALFAAMNTMGDGANDDFAGRTPVDKAMLDRFAFPYCAMFEEATARRLCKDDDLVDLILDWNQSCVSSGLTKAVLSYRTMNGFKMAKKAGFSLRYAIGKITMGQTRDTLDTIWSGMAGNKNRKYWQVLKTAIEAVPMDR